jgi:hypothetical protein
MFILIYSDNELLKSDNTVEVFPTYDRAYHEMVRQLEEEAARGGLTLNEGPGDLTGTDETYGGVGWCGYLNETEAYLDFRSECKWVIFEVPGIFVPQEDAVWVRSCLRDFGVGQTNFEASEMALDVCNVLKKYA